MNDKDLIESLSAQIADLNRQLATAREDMKHRCASVCETHKTLMDNLGEKANGHVAAFLEHRIRPLPTDGEAG